MIQSKFSIDHQNIRNKLLNYTHQFNNFFFYDSNSDVNISSALTYQTYDFIVALGIQRELKFESGDSFEQLETFHKANNTWLFGYLAYDLKNEIEELYSKNEDILNISNIQFIEPQIVIAIIGSEMLITVIDHKLTAEKIAEDILKIEAIEEIELPKSKIRAQTSKTDYINTFNRLQAEINYGNIYEINYCIAFKTQINHQHWQELYLKLNSISKAPFSALVKINNTVIISASPERFLKKEGNKLVSQPIKGTKKRENDFTFDNKQKEILYNDEKERSENVMITDLVRNDLSKYAKRNTVKVEELFGIYSFKQVHQMISTVTADLSNNNNYIKALKEAFPMGSMTGAPKLKAMQLIEKHEQMKRSLYSGALGYLTPNGNYDFNVLIRSLIVNTQSNQAQFCVGSAITHKANAENEYEECLLKAQALFQVLT
jgi:para-aminobenzoate synthetase component 1